MKRILFVALACIIGGVAQAAPDTLLYVSLNNRWRTRHFNDRLINFLKENGFPKFHQLASDEFDSAALAAAKLVIVEYGSSNYNIDAHDRQVLEALVAYAKAGGGLVVINNLNQQMPEMNCRFELMKMLGGKVRFTMADIPKDRKFQIGDYTNDEFVETKLVDPEFAKGVGTVYLPARADFNDWHGIFPCEILSGWRSIVDLDVPEKVFPDVGLPYLDHEKKGLVPNKERISVIAVREFGKGRVCWMGVYFGMWGGYLTRNTLEKGTDEVMAAVMTEGVSGRPKSDFAQLAANIFNWTAAHSSTVSAADFPAFTNRAEFEKALPTGYRVRRGVIGPRTTYSIGKSTPEEYIAKAKSLGHDFIVFLEDFEHISAEKYEKLRALCLQKTDDDFTVYCGYTFRNSDGNCQYVWGQEPLYPGPAVLTADGKRLRQDNPRSPLKDGNRANMDLYFYYGVLGFRNNRGWYMHHESPYAPTDMRNIQSMAYMTRVKGRTVETAEDVYKLNTRNGQQLMPETLELIESVDDLTERTWTAYWGMDSLRDFREIVRSHPVHSLAPANVGCFGCSGTTSGPIVEFRTSRGDMSPTIDRLYQKDLDHWPYTIDVKGIAALDRVELWDGDRLVRSWRVKGEKTFSRKGEFTNERMHFYWVKAIDATGGIAVTRPVNSNSFLLREAQCTDRNNQMLYTEQLRPNGEPRQIASHCADSAIADKGPWYGRVRPVGFYVFDKKWGLGGDGGFDGSPEDHPTANLVPSIVYGDIKPKSMGYPNQFVSGHEGGAHLIPHRVVAGQNALVADRVFDGAYPRDQKNILHCWATLYPVIPSRFADTTARVSFFLPKLDGVIPYQWEQNLTLKAPIPTVKHAPFVSFGYVRASTACDMVTAKVGGKVIENAFNKLLPLRPGDYLVLRDKKFGSLAVYPLSPVVWKSGELMRTGNGLLAKAQSSYPFDVVLVGMHKGHNANAFEFADEVRKAYGIGEAKPSVYSWSVEEGVQLQPRGVYLDGVALKGALVGSFKDLAAMPGTLGLRLSGLRDNVSALLITEDGLVRSIPVENGTTYVALGNEEDGKKLFIGQPIVAADSDVVIHLARMKGLSKWSLEVHNPTACTIRTKVSSDPRQTVFSFSEEVELAPGTSKDFQL